MNFKNLLSNPLNILLSLTLITSTSVGQCFYLCGLWISLIIANMVGMTNGRERLSEGAEGKAMT